MYMHMTSPISSTIPDAHGGPGPALATGRSSAAMLTESRRGPGVSARGSKGLELRMLGFIGLGFQSSGCRLDAKNGV